MFQKLVKSLSPFCKEQIRRNIETEWIRSANVLCPTRVFVRNDFSNSSKEELRNSQLKDAIEMYNTELRGWIGQGSSFAIVQNSPQHNQIGMLLLTPKVDTRQHQQLLVRNRNHWYKEHSLSPLVSGFKSVVDEEKDTVNIVYDKKLHSNDSKTIPLDEIRLSNREQPEDLDYNILVCNTDLDACLDAFLDDSYTECSDGKSILKLHQSLVPFKLAITFQEGIEEPERNKLLEVVNYLLNQLKECPEVAVFPFVKDRPISVAESDALLIPFCVVVTSESLKNGVVQIRNRDTRIAESLHVSSFLKNILLYVQPIKLL